MSEFVKNKIPLDNKYFLISLKLYMQPLNTETYQWDPPVPHPYDGAKREWDEEAQIWAMDP